MTLVHEKIQAKMEGMPLVPFLQVIKAGTAVLMRKQEISVVTQLNVKPYTRYAYHYSLAVAGYALYS